MDRRAAAIAQFQVAGDEVRVKVGEKDVTDLEAEIVRISEVLMNIALRIDDDCGSDFLHRRAGRMRGRGSRGSTVSGS